MLYFAKCFFCINWEDHVVLVSSLIYVFYHIDWFVNVKPPLHHRDKSYLVMMDNPFNVLLARILLRILVSIFISDIGLKFSFLVGSLPGLGIKVMLATVAKLWKEPRCPSMGEWIRKMWSIYTMAYYASIRKDEYPTFVATWTGLERLCWVK